ncbi:MAG TPA: serine/threonine-protein kinase PknK, partial [Planctomycetes bacterium]|nr:serine/threonine-protein kinase PknK [Planctomycetota bacterium]
MLHSVQQIGHYQILGELGRGGMGAVYRAAHPSGAVVALKLIHDRRQELLARFEREANVMAQLQGTPGVVPLLDAGVAPQGPYFTMPLFPGGDLSTRLREGALPLPEAERLARELAQALGWIHRVGMVHRDLKPGNVLFDEAGAAWVADLGLAKHSGSDDGLSKTNETRGTPGYMAPEQLSDAKHVGPAVDVFAWGAVIYECLTGARPFQAGSLVEELARTAEGRLRPIRQARPEAPPALTSLVVRALASDPAQRPPDGRALERL